MEPSPLSKQQVVERLTAVRAQIEALGVRRVALFGSTVRGEAQVDSDVDLLVEFEPEKKTLRSFLALSDLLETVLERRTDLLTYEGLSPYIGPHILREAEDVLRAA